MEVGFWATSVPSAVVEPWTRPPWMAPPPTTTDQSEALAIHFGMGQGRVGKGLAILFRGHVRGLVVDELIFQHPEQALAAMHVMLDRVGVVAQAGRSAHVFRARARILHREGGV